MFNLSNFWFWFDVRGQCHGCGLDSTLFDNGFWYSGTKWLNGQQTKRGKWASEWVMQSNYATMDWFVYSLCESNSLFKQQSLYRHKASKGKVKSYNEPIDQSMELRLSWFFRWMAGVPRPLDIPLVGGGERDLDIVVVVVAVYSQWWWCVAFDNASVLSSFLLLLLSFFALLSNEATTNLYLSWL